MVRVLRYATVAILLVATIAAPPAAATDRPHRGPAGPRFYDPPDRLVNGRAGTMVWFRRAAPLVRVDDARRTLTYLYRSRAIDGSRTVMSASLALPKGPAPRGGWRAVVWNHVTTGAADSCAPTRTTARSPELEKMTRGDPTVRELLARGLAVVRPDYEGIGTPGPHPYLISRSLRRSTIDAIRAARAAEPQLGRRWLVAGHSEGGHASLFTAANGVHAAAGLSLRGAAAVAPPSHIRDLFQLGELVPVAGPGVADLSALAGLILHGAALEDPQLAVLYRKGGLSARAIALWPHLEERCFLELAVADSWGGLAPSEIAGPNADALRSPLYAVLERNDVLGVEIPAEIPVRIDQGLLDPVVPFTLTERLVANLRAQGLGVTYERHPTATHQNITRAEQAAVPLARWAAAALD